MHHLFVVQSVSRSNNNNLAGWYRTNVGQVRGEFQAIDDFTGKFHISFDTKGEDTAICLTAEERVCERMRLMRFETEVGYPGNLWVFLQVAVNRSDEKLARKA